MTSWRTRTRGRRGSCGESAGWREEKRGDEPGEGLPEDEVDVRAGIIARGVDCLPAEALHEACCDGGEDAPACRVVRNEESLLQSFGLGSNAQLGSGRGGESGAPEQPETLVPPADDKGCDQDQRDSAKGGRVSTLVNPKPKGRHSQAQNPRKSVKLVQERWRRVRMLRCVSYCASKGVDDVLTALSAEQAISIPPSHARSKPGRTRQGGPYERNWVLPRWSIGEDPLEESLEGNVDPGSVADKNEARKGSCAPLLLESGRPSASSWEKFRRWERNEKQLKGSRR